MKLRTSVLALIGFLAAAPVFAAEQTVKFSVPNMTCASCPYIVESAMRRVEGVIQVKVDAGSRTAVVVFDNAIAKAKDFVKASMVAGYTAVLVSQESGS